MNQINIALSPQTQLPHMDEIKDTIDAVITKIYWLLCLTNKYSTEELTNG